MNTPDLGPKDGDFVAYIEQLERQQLRSVHASATVAAGAFPNPSSSSAAAASTNAPTLAATATAVKGVPLGLIAVGLVLVIAGAAVDGGIFLVAIGVLLLWQAARAMIRNARAASAGNKTQAAQQVANLLAAHTLRKKPPAK